MKKKLFLIVSIMFVIINSYGQNFWKKVNEENLRTSSKVDRAAIPTNYQVFSLDIDGIKTQLSKTKLNTSRLVSDVILSFPNAEGKLEVYRIYEAPVMEAELSAKLPNIKSYIGKSIENPSSSIRFSVTLFGLHTMTFSGLNEISYIDPYTKDLKNYILYKKSDLVNPNKFNCGVVENESQFQNLEQNNNNAQVRANNSLFKTYRLAMACTIEYAAYHVNTAGLSGATEAEKKDAVLAAMNVTMTRVNGVYERELAITLVIINNNRNIINIVSDNYTNNDGAILINENQTEVDAIIGTANYDIGHVVSTGGGGIAQLQSPCSASKARGVTGLPSPVGDPFNIDYVAHEMGHQFGGSHTFNSDQGSCGGNRSSTSAYEPGSGTTIMAYAGICSPQNVQSNSDAYFHARSLLQMAAFINGGGNCAVIQANGNTPPTINAGLDYTIPFGTPFKLTATATDIETPNLLTYCWEQYNFTSTVQPIAVTNTVGPNFRSFSPSVSPIRYFPKTANVLANNLATAWEFVPNVARTMMFSLVVRDNGTVLGGQTQRDTMNLTFANVGPFNVTSQNTTTTWAQNSSQNIVWNVAGTDANGINTTNVDIKLSTDGGITYPIILATNTPNDGSETITVPAIPNTQTGRIMVEAVGNVFYAINTAPIYIGYELVSSCNTYNFTTPFNLTDGTTVYTYKSINVPTAGTITDVNITVNATHSDLQNLVMLVARPGGSSTAYFNQQCTGNSNMNVTFDAQAAAFACASPLQGTMAPPIGNLNGLNGFSQNGVWNFGFRDAVAGNTGSIDSFSLNVCSNNYVPLTNKSFEFQDFIMYPNPNAGTFTIKFNSESNNKINIQVHDLKGRTIFDRNFNNSGLFNEKLELNKVQSGIYLVSISDGAKKTVKRIIIE